MTIVVNGQTVELPEKVATVTALLFHFHLENKMIVVERNQAIVDRAHYGDEAIESGDRIEIVHFVGGG